MRPLPEHPNLDHLRRQAKDLLTEMRGGSPTASLNDAQAAIAAEYGFASWSDLKTEVDRRRATVQPADPGVAAAIASAFALGAVREPMVPDSRGAVTSSWSLTTERGRWCVVQIATEAQPEDFADGIALQEAATALDAIDVPVPVRTTTGDVIVRVAGPLWRVYPWTVHGPSPTKPVGASIASALGRALAALHGLALPAHDPIHPWLTCRRPEDDWRTLAAKARSAEVAWAAGLEAALPKLFAVSEAVGDGIVAAGSDHPAILCHRNITPMSVRTNGAGPLTVLDWEYSGSLPARWELGYVLLQFGTGAGSSVNDDAVRALVRGYREGGGDDSGFDATMFVTAVTAGLNWTATRVEKVLTAEDGDARDRATRELAPLLSDPMSMETVERLLQAASSA